MTTRHAKRRSRQRSLRSRSTSSSRARYRDGKSYSRWRLISPSPATPARASRRRLRDATGTLILVGGGTTPTGTALASFIDMSGAREGAPIVGLTTASSEVVASRDRWLADLAEAGATACNIPIIETRDQAQDPELVALFRNARGIFLGGGDQVKLVSALSGTPLEAAIRDAFIDGAIICGTSAGAAALTKTTLAGNEVDDEGKLVEQYIGPGLGLLGFHALVDTHFTQRRRLYRLFVAIAEFPALMGLGIDEDTAFIVKKDIGTVIGAGGVTFVDGSSVRFNNAADVTKGPELTISALRVGIVGTGQQFNLRKREVQALLAPPESGPALTGNPVTASR